MSNLLTSKQTHSLHETLRARHKVLSELIHFELTNSTNTAHVELAGLVHDTKEVALASALRNVDLKVVQMHIRELDDIAAAEQRIAGNAFGQCIDCEQEIGYPRLTAYPTAKRCIGCQTTHEKQSSHRR